MSKTHREVILLQLKLLVFFPWICSLCIDSSIRQFF
jgi:hypothetical protein